MRTWQVFLLLIFGSCLWNRALAFPEMTRFGYNTCSACHVAPSGGGILTSYGKSLSSEVLSTWGTEGEAGLLHGVLGRDELEKWLLVGGDFRAVQIHKEDSVQKTGRFIKMQADLSLAVVRDAWAVSLTVGELLEDVWREVGAQYYGLWRPRDEFSIRAGRFIPQYGLFIMDHIAFVRNFTGFGLGAVRDVIETQWTGTDWTVNLSAAQSQPHVAPEKLWTSEVQYAFFEKNKLAFQVLNGSSDASHRDLLGFWGVLAVTPKLYWMFEVDQQNKTASSVTNRGVVSYQKWGYSLAKGLDAFLLCETQQSDMTDSKTALRRIGPGLQFFPRPHFEFSAVWTKQQVQSPTTEESDYAWILLHYYL